MASVSRLGDNFSSVDCSSQQGAAFIPALIVVDMQEDFCPPNGSLAVQDGRSIAPLINSLLDTPGFVIRIATQDFHPADHISFAISHPPPNNRPFESVIEMKNPVPGKESDTRLQRLWPVHCVADTPGAAIIPEVNTEKIDVRVRKGRDSRVDMYSAFSDNFGNLNPPHLASSVDVDIKATLFAKGVTDVFVVGLSGDYCVKFTAIDAARSGFKCFVIEEGTRCIDSESGWKEELKAAGVSIIAADGPEVARVKSRA